MNDSIRQQINLLVQMLLQGPSDKVWFRQLRDEIDRLEYLATPKEGFHLQPRTFDTSIRCSAEGCEVDWHTLDACLLRIGEAWYCRSHHPPRSVGAVPYVGFVPPEAERLTREAKVKETLNLVPQADRHLINPRIVR